MVDIMRLDETLDDWPFAAAAAAAAVDVTSPAYYFNDDDGAIAANASSADGRPPSNAGELPPICNSSGPQLHECLMPLSIKSTEFSVPVYGFISPAVILLTVVTNCLICVVLLRRNMRSATNVLLVAMALSDMMTGVWPLPCFVYFYTLGGYREWVSYDWCAIYMALTDLLPTVFHTASIWMTVTLGVQRYICVCRPQAAKTLCTIPNVLRAITGVYLAACLTHATRFVESSYRPVELPSLSDETKMTIGCIAIPAHFVANNMNVYFNVYYWFRVIFINLVPCSVLIVFNALLVQTLRQAQRRRRQLLAQNWKSESRRLAESSVTTMMLVAVVGVFLLVEFPLALLMIVMIVDNSFDLTLLDTHSRTVAPLFVNLFILLSYPLNFFIYCGMSRQFRDTFKGLFARGGAAGGVDGAVTKTDMTVLSGGGCTAGGRSREGLLLAGGAAAAGRPQ